ncbi:unnamed protein product [Aphanomyces euteiches]|uniref:Mis18 domain-containing protein n=1 Tax=Aphanomyces euteiches TaxID=100861 RepID=A0A6G0WLM3_9STRA|nr:hypothetical protein Ae201684_014001 [Aphanomyces euteiches]KAH9105737.1 hypothetical protein AeMF1_018538 [Aphanomyces euteiches]KAH9110886.1 hypothetical protein LEN26_013603 [Aphanomyces euteiches]KAH9156932.1 hypothetical protein AeRB84_001178 [Aphanomyces euteiches]KAH9189650.1 hypothetical protein AeNC1_008370 [Aphanomyces euteiches]
MGHWGNLMHASEAGDEEVVEVPFPVVFQCRTCRAIVADSTAFSSSNVSNRTITFSRVAHVEKSEKTASEGGNSYYNLMCTQCDGRIGKMYIGTVRALDPIRDLYTLDADALTNYQIGTQLADDAPSPTTRSLDYDTSTAVIEQLRTDMDQVQNYLLLVDERLCDMEQDLQR